MSEHEDVLAFIRTKNQAPLTLDPPRTALLVNDVQRYFVRPEYPFGRVLEGLSPGITAGYFRRVQNTVVPNIRRLQDTFRSRGGPIFYTGTGTRMGDGRDLPGWLRDLDQLGLAVLGARIWPAVEDPSWQVDDSVAPLPSEPVLIKTSSGPLASTKLDQTLRNMGIDSVVVTGLTTDVCVSQTAREMADRGVQRRGRGGCLHNVERRDASRRAPGLQHRLWTGAHDGRGAGAARPVRCPGRGSHPRGPHA